MRIFCCVFFLNERKNGTESCKKKMRVEVLFSNVFFPSLLGDLSPCGT